MYVLEHHEFEQKFYFQKGKLEHMKHLYTCFLRLLHSLKKI